MCLAKLSELKFAMGLSIFIASFIFGIFLIGAIFLIQAYFVGFDTLIGVILAIGGTALFILFQYAIGPFIVSATTHLQYVKPGESPWLETTVKETCNSA